MIRSRAALLPQHLLLRLELARVQVLLRLAERSSSPLLAVASAPPAADKGGKGKGAPKVAEAAADVGDSSAELLAACGKQLDVLDARLPPHVLPARRTVERRRRRARELRR